MHKSRWIAVWIWLLIPQDDGYWDDPSWLGEGEWAFRNDNLNLGLRTV